MPHLNPFTTPGQWHKAKFHAHSTTSDGQLAPQEVARQYRQAGYSVLAITDHWKTNAVDALCHDDFLLINGMEFHPPCPGSDVQHHLVALNVPADFNLPETLKSDALACVAAFHDAGSKIMLAHPLWCGHRFDQYGYLLNEMFAIEVFNRAGDGIGRSSGETDWCHILDAGWMLPALAVDDVHSTADLFGGWVQLRLKELSPQSVLSALEAGCFYSSTGPEILDFRIESDVITIHCSPVAAIYFMADTWHGDSRNGSRGNLITTFERTRDPAWRYVRAVVVDEFGKKAWTNAIPLQ